MNVRIESVLDEVVVLGPSAIRFRVAFWTDTLRGKAWFVPSGGGSEPPHCGNYAVETGMRAVADCASCLTARRPSWALPLYRRPAITGCMAPSSLCGPRARRAAVHTSGPVGGHSCSARMTAAG